jgi:hypothetical protein
MWNPVPEEETEVTKQGIGPVRLNLSAILFQQNNSVFSHNKSASISATIFPASRTGLLYKQG